MSDAWRRSRIPHGSMHPRRSVEGSLYGSSHGRGAADSKKFLTSWNEELNIITHHPSSIITRNMTSKAFARAIRLMFPCASPKTNTLANVLDEPIYSSKLDELKRPECQKKVCRHVLQYNKGAPTIIFV